MFNLHHQAATDGWEAALIYDSYRLCRRQWRGCQKRVGYQGLRLTTSFQLWQVEMNQLQLRHSLRESVWAELRCKEHDCGLLCFQQKFIYSEPLFDGKYRQQRGRTGSFWLELRWTGARHQQIGDNSCHSWIWHHWLVRHSLWIAEPITHHPQVRLMNREQMEINGGRVECTDHLSC